MSNIPKLNSPYVLDTYKSFILENLSIILNQLNYLIKNGYRDDLLKYLNNDEVLDSIQRYNENLLQIFNEFVLNIFNVSYKNIL